MRPSFTKDASGSLIRNYYCMECYVGPFNQADIDNHILIETGWGNQTSRHCRKCCTIKLPKVVLHEVEDHYLEREKYVLSGKAMEDLKSNKTPPSFEKKVYEKPVIIEIPQEKIAVLFPEEIKEIKEDNQQLIEEILDEKEQKVSLKNLSGSAIINLVEKRTGFRLQLSPKSKKSVIRHAKKMLEEKGLKVFV